MKLELRPLQAALVGNVSQKFREGFKRVMVYAPCGFGKTEVATAMLQACYSNGKYGSFIADRISLITQTSERFDKYELPHGIMQAQNPRYAPSERIQVCSIQTLQRRRWPDGNLMMVDEAHVLPEALRKKLEARDRFAVGLSATPLTPGLGRYFDCVINAATTNQLIDMGLLVEPTIYSFEAPNMEGVHAGSGGEYDDKETEERVLQVVGDVVKTYVEKGQGKKFIAFGWNIAHAMELQRQFLAAGINVATYTADDDPEDRHECVQEFRKPDSAIRGLISVEALTRGFDVTDVEILIDAHPLRTAWWVYVQMLGRVMRSHDGKTGCMVFDHSGNCVHFWSKWKHLFEHGVSELDDGERKEKDGAAEKDEPAPIKCPQCGHLHKPMPSCPQCGHEYPKKAPIEHVPGTLKEIIESGDKNLMRRNVWPMVCALVAEQKAKHPDRYADIAKCQSTAQSMYRDLTGSFALGRYENTAPQPPTEEIRKRVHSNRIRFAKGREAARRRASQQGAPA